MKIKLLKGANIGIYIIYLTDGFDNVFVFKS